MDRESLVHEFMGTKEATGVPLVVVRAVVDFVLDKVDGVSPDTGHTQVPFPWGMVTLPSPKSVKRPNDV